MKDPRFSSCRFVPDRVGHTTRLLDYKGLAQISGALIEGDAVGFRSRTRLTIELPLPESDLSRFDRLSILVKNVSDRPLLAGITLFHGPETEDSETGGVSFTGGREYLPPGTWIELKFPVESFGSYYAPKHWRHIRRAQLAIGREKTDDSTGEIAVWVQGVQVEARDVPVGPRLTIEGLADVLLHDVPGVTSFRTNRNAFKGSPSDESPPTARTGILPVIDSQGDAEKSTGISGGQCIDGWSLDPYGAANSALAIPPPHPYPLEDADQILTGHIMGQHVEEPVPWDADPLGIQDWTHFLNRHHFMKTLVRALAGSGDEQYARALDRMIASWIIASPVPVDSNGGAGPAWETLSAAWRLREWLWIIGIAWPHPAFRSETKSMMLRSVWEHARTLMDHKGHPNNWIIVESAALALAGICFPQFREAKSWAAAGIERLHKEFGRQFFEDGAHFELSPLYHAICLHALLEVKEAAYARDVALPDEFGAPLERCAEYLAGLYRPDFTWPSLNDSGGATSDFTALMGKAGELFGRPDFIWIGTSGRDGSPPHGKSAEFPHAGVAVMRSAHEHHANHLVFRAGPAGATHVHNDVLSLDLTALGLPRLVDPGVTSYAPDPLTDCYRSTGSHNSILIDGKGASRTSLSFSRRTRPAGEDFSWSASGPLEIASGLYRGPWEKDELPVTVLRTILFVCGEYWIVRDFVAGSGDHDVTTCWQFFPGRVEIDIETYALRFVDTRGPRFELWPVPGNKAPEIEIFTGATHPPRGWVSIEGADYPATNCRYNFRTGLPFTMMWLLLPSRGRSISGIKQNFEIQDDETHALEIQFPQGHTDFISTCTPQIPGNGRPDVSGAGLHGTITFFRSVDGRSIRTARCPY